MAGGGGTTTLMSIPENCTAKHYWSGSSYTWADCQVPQEYSNYVYIKIFDSEGKDITESCYIDNTFDMGDGEVQKVTDYRINSNLTGSYFYFSVGGAVIDVSITLNESSNPVGNIPMGELTFNGVQSVTYNGIDYTKLVVDGASYPPPVIISFTIAGTSYQAEDGMTWAEWVESSYNTNSFSFQNDLIKAYSTSTSLDDMTYVCVGNIVVTKTDEIISNQSYTLQRQGNISAPR